MEPMDMKITGSWPASSQLASEGARGEPGLCDGKCTVILREGPVTALLFAHLQCMKPRLTVLGSRGMSWPSTGEVK